VKADEILAPTHHHMLWNYLSAAESNEPELGPDQFFDHLEPRDSVLLWCALAV